MMCKAHDVESVYATVLYDPPRSCRGVEWIINPWLANSLYKVIFCQILFYKIWS